MAFELHRFPGIPGLAASAINLSQAVTGDVGDTQRQFLPVATNNVAIDGIAAATAAAAGAITVYDDHHIVKVTACASLGAGIEVGVASTNGQFGAVSGASGITRWVAGKSLTAAAAGETFSLYVRPRQISNLI